MEVPFQYGRLAEAESFIDRIDDRRELKNRDAFSFVDPLFELWLKREYGII